MMSMHTDDQRQVTVPAAWAGTHLDHGYAMTCHKAQGATVDIALLYGTGALTREAGYVALSRGRTANHLYVPDDHDDRAVASMRSGTSTGSPPDSPSASTRPSLSANCPAHDQPLGCPPSATTLTHLEPKGYPDDRPVLLTPTEAARPLASAAASCTN